LNIDPVLLTNIIEQEGHKIGYIMYTQFSDNYQESIDNAMQYFVDNEITDLVVDLRYNPGGYGFVAQHFCSSVAPIDVVNAEEILYTNQYNKSYTAYFEQNDINYIQKYFSKDVPVKMGLDKIHVLTGRGTASASELFIVGLGPYMDLTTIGETTYGKYTGSWTIRPEDVMRNSSDYKDFEKWGVQPITSRYANSLGVTDFKDGILPDIEVYDELFEAVPLGQKEEPLLKAAIEDITGTPIIAMKSAKKPEIPQYFIFDRGSSKFDRIKREMVIENIEKEFFK
jgi:C-terminal processing protease CtpA/Prc